MGEINLFYLEVKKLFEDWEARERESVERGLGPRKVALSWILGNLEVLLERERRRTDG